MFFLGIAGEDGEGEKVFRGCTYKPIAINKRLHEYNFAVDFRRMKNYNGEHDNQTFTFRELYACQRNFCNSSKADHISSKPHILICVLFICKYFVTCISIDMMKILGY